MSTNPDEGFLQQEGYDFMNACFAVHNEYGGGFLEEVYQECLEIELTDRQIPYVAQPRLQLFYKGRALKKQYQADLIVIGEILVELKAVKALTPEHEAQLINYLKATRKRVGYLVNFAAPRVQWQRIIL
jgi:GxxExxY protein